MMLLVISNIARAIPYSVGTIFGEGGGRAFQKSLHLRGYTQRQFVTGCRRGVCYISDGDCPSVSWNATRNVICRIKSQGGQTYEYSDDAGSSTPTQRCLGLLRQICCLSSGLSSSIYSKLALSLLSEDGEGGTLGNSLHP